MHTESIDLIDTASADGHFDSPIRFGIGNKEETKLNKRKTPNHNGNIVGIKEKERSIGQKGI